MQQSLGFFSVPSLTRFSDLSGSMQSTFLTFTARAAPPGVLVLPVVKFHNVCRLYRSHREH
ncbi:hypothetical protein E2C01_003243 [Portunus trituberculatus]|uniref:Uncharacterized protein n=1 Tax=Portunus trituberculatus TaxID=210409 RepID=A0A5B7CQJ7_PORTR|nr:hypothetical protein [Portunus trituberculatus]